MEHINIGPFVKWAGGKKQLLPKLVAEAPKEYGAYFEPFIGGGALLFELQPNTAVINDVNAQLWNVYTQLKKDANQVILALRSLDAEPCDKDRYMSLRETYNGKIQRNELDAECAALMIWVNKHCFNGLYRVNSKGLFNVPYNNKPTGRSMNEDNLRGIGEFLRAADVRIILGDFETACEDVKAGDFVYFDSPYIPISETANFTDYTKDGFTYDDHKRLADLFRRLDGIGAKVLLSNHAVPLAHELYDGYTIETISVRRNINSDASKRSGTEVIVKNY